MEKKKILRFQIFSVIFTWILGTILHFLYEWSGDNKIIASFSAVNESTWEHLKLVFFPMLITTIVGFLVIGKDNKKFWCAKTIGIILAMSFIIVFFYTYTGIIGTNFAILDIGSFFVVFCRIAVDCFYLNSGYFLKPSENRNIIEEKVKK